jgi:hypothetical protein
MWNPGKNKNKKWRDLFKEKKESANGVLHARNFFTTNNAGNSRADGIRRRQTRFFHSTPGKLTSPSTLFLKGPHRVIKRIKLYKVVGFYSLYVSS